MGCLVFLSSVTFARRYLDWFGLMAYDLAGWWDKKTGYHSGLYASGGSLTLNQVLCIAMRNSR